MAVFGLGKGDLASRDVLAGGSILCFPSSPGLAVSQGAKPLAIAEVEGILAMYPDLENKLASESTAVELVTSWRPYRA